jgi:hypothetical protein
MGRLEFDESRLRTALAVEVRIRQKHERYFPSLKRFLR